MDKEQTKACIEIMQAYVDGKEIQFRSDPGDEWQSTRLPAWDWAAWEYRIKPAPKIIYVNEYNHGCFAHKYQDDATKNGVNWQASDIAVPYVRLSDVELLK